MYRNHQLPDVCICKKKKNKILKWYIYIISLSTGSRDMKYGSLRQLEEQQTYKIVRAKEMGNGNTSIPKRIWE